MRTLALWQTTGMGCRGGTRSAKVSEDWFKGVEAWPVRELSLAMRELSLTMRELSLAMREPSLKLLFVVCLTSFGPRGDMLSGCVGSA